MSNYQRILMRLSGFCDGAGAKGMRREYEQDKDYERGYVDGQKAKREYAKASAEELGVQLREVVSLKVRG